MKPITPGRGYYFNCRGHKPEDFIYIVDHITSDGSVAIQKCIAKGDKTMGDSPAQWVYLYISEMDTMIRHGIYIPILHKTYMKEVKRFHA